MAIADGTDQVLMRTREQLRQGATQIKLMAGGGVSSDYDPLDVTQYTLAEIKSSGFCCRELEHLCNRTRIHITKL